MNKKPNIVLIICDQLRWDSLGYAGHPAVYTPHLDQLANEGINFTNAYSAVPSCIAAMAALLTGMYQRTHGRTGYEDCIPFKYKNTLPGCLSEAGYHTQSIGKNHFYPARSLCGYHNTVLMDGYISEERGNKKDYNLVDDYLIELKKEAGIDADVTFHGLSPNSYVSRPFFLKLSYLAPHPPYVPSKDFLDMYNDRDIPEPVYGDWAGEPDPLSNVNESRGKLTADQLTKLKRAYYAMITQIDYQVGRFIMHLKEQEELDNTIIVFTSDHGEMLGDHHLFRKAVPFNGSARIPMFINWGSDVNIKKKCCEVSKIIELRDIMPSLLDILDIPILDSVEGKSFLKLIQQNKKDTNWKYFLHGEHCLEGIPGYEKFGSNQYLVTENEKYIWFPKSGEELYFDLSVDPDELNNIASSSPERIKYFRELMSKELSGREEGYVKNGVIINGTIGRNTLDFLRKSI